jgi:transposase
MKKTTKSIKFHTDENFNKTERTKIFLSQCNGVGNILLYHHFGAIIETNKYEFINNTKDYNNVFFKIRSHHYQQIQERVFNTIWLRYEQAIKQTKFDDSKLNYLRYFCFKWDDVDNYLAKKNGDFYRQVRWYWLQHRNEIIPLIEKEVLNKIRISKLPKFKKLVIKVDNRTTHFQPTEQADHFDYWLSIFTNTKIKNKYENINIPIKWSGYHEDRLNGTKLNNSFIVKFDEIYDRLEIIGSYSEPKISLNLSKPCQTNTLGVDVGISKLLTFSDGYQVDTTSLQNEFERFLKYEKQVKRLEAKGLYDSNKYLRKQRQLTNKVENEINRCLNNIPDEIEYVVFEDLKFKDKISRKINYLIRRFQVQGILTKAELKLRPFKIQSVNPAYTSQQCRICNFTDRSNRTSQSKFICKNCGHAENADVNASLNIKERFLDVRFKKLKYQGQIKKFLRELFEAGQVCHNQTSQLSTGFT